MASLLSIWLVFRCQLRPDLPLCAVQRVRNVASQAAAVKLLQRATTLILSAVQPSGLRAPLGGSRFKLWPLMLPLFGHVRGEALVLPNSSHCAMAGHGHQAGV